MSAKRPKLMDAKVAFRAVYEDVGKTVSGVGTKIGGKVDYNINKIPEGQGRFENACAIRLSYVLNQTGFKIPYIAGQTVSGSNGSWYIYKVKTMTAYLHKTFGPPDHTFNNPSAYALAKHKGILVFEVDGWSDASGHATIWNGVNCSDSCYFAQSKKAYLWTLKE